MAKKKNRKGSPIKANTNNGAPAEGINRAPEESNPPAPEEVPQVPIVEESNVEPTVDISRLSSMERFQLRINTAGERAVDRLIDFIYCFMYCFRKFRKGVYTTGRGARFLLKVVSFMWSILRLNQIWLYLLTVYYGFTFQFPVGEIVGHMNFVVEHTIHYYKLFVLVCTVITFLNHCVNLYHDEKQMLRDMYVMCYAQACTHFLAQTKQLWSLELSNVMFGMVYARTLFETSISENRAIRQSVSDNAVWWWWYSHAVSVFLLTFFLVSYDILKWTEWFSKYVDKLVGWA